MPDLFNLDGINVWMIANVGDRCCYQEGQMDQDIFKHDHAISSWITLCISRDGVTTTVLMVETDLNLNAKDSNYRKDSIDGFVSVIVNLRTDDLARSQFVHGLGAVSRKGR